MRWNYQRTAIATAVTLAITGVMTNGVASGGSAPAAPASANVDSAQLAAPTSTADDPTSSDSSSNKPAKKPKKPKGPKNRLLVGAAKVDITPGPDNLPDRYTGVHDPIFARAITIQQKNETAALITVDAGGVSTEIWSEVTDRLHREFRIDPENVMLAATHSHSAPRQNYDGYADLVVQSVADSLDTAEPARMGFGTGSSHLNVNRNIIDEETGTWWEGPNRDGISDKTVAVVSFETLKGDPIAVYYNYAMHAVTNGMLDMVSADYPGATSKYLEESLGGDTVAVFSSGAAGDQNPLFFNQTYELRDIRIKEYAERGEDISNSMPPGGEGLDRSNPRVALLLDQQAQLSDSMGQMLGEEVLSVTRTIENWSTSSAISSDSSVATCPGRVRTDEGRAGQPGEYVDGEDVKIRLSVLKVGDLYLAGVNGEVFNDIGQRLVRESPFKQTMMTTLTNGRSNSGYIYNDESAGFYVFEVLSSKLKPGCAENAIVDGLLDLMKAAK